MTADAVLLNVEGHVAQVTLNRPQKLNALDLDVLEALSDVCRRLSEDDDVRAVQLLGSGTAFCAGADLEYVDSIRTDATRVREFLAALHDVVVALERLPQPVVAGVHGVVLAGGLELVLGCDLIVAAESARIGDQHVNWGFVPGGGSTQRLPRWIGAARARELLYTGRWMSAAEARDAGLVARVVADDKVAAASFELASEIAGKSPAAITRIKRLSRLAEDTDLETGLVAEIDIVADYYGHPQFAQGLAAFKARTPPTYT